MRSLFLCILSIALTTLASGQAVLLQEDFEGSTSVFSSSSSSGNGSSWQPSSYLSHSAAHSDSNIVQLNDTLYLTSQAFSTKAHTEVYLSFEHIAKIYLFDRAVIEVSGDNGNSWTQLGNTEYLGSGFLNSNSFSSLSYSIWTPANNTAIPTNTWWQNELFDLSLIGNADSARIRFSLMDADNNGARGNYGWLIDDVKITSPGIKRTFSYLFEDFNNGIPSGWTNNAVSGTFTWMQGKMFDVSDNVLASLDGTAMVYFNDDSLGQTQVNNTVELLSPVVSTIPNVPLMLEFDYNYRMYLSATDYFKVEVFDGSNWVSLVNHTVDDCGRWIGPCMSNLPKAQFDISSYSNSNLQLKFSYHDGNDWAYWAAFDNVHIYSPDSYYAIGTINTVDAVGNADSLHVKTWTSGTVAGVDLDGNAGYSFTLMDFSSGFQEGISIKSSDDINNYVVNEGDSLLIFGLVDQYQGMQQFVADTILLLASNRKLPSAKQVSILDEGAESQLILLNEMSVVSKDSSSKGFFVGLANLGDTMMMKVEPATDVDDFIQFKLGDYFCGIKGIGMQADSSSPFLDDYYIVSMRHTDLGFPPQIDLGNDTSLCASSPYTLDAGAGFETYQWNTGDTTRFLQVDQNTDSLYVVTAINSLGCIAVDSIIVEVDICTGLAEKSALDAFKIYPNPTKEHLYIETQKPVSEVEIQLLDQQGKIIESKIMLDSDFKLKIEVSHLPKGLYFLKILSDEKTEFKKVVLF